jgi:hypothetical protein
MNRACVSREMLMPAIPGGINVKGEASHPAYKEAELFAGQ